MHDTTVSLSELAQGEAAQREAAQLLQGVPALQFLPFATENLGLDIVGDVVTLYKCAGIRYAKHVGLPPQGCTMRASPSWYGRPRFDNVMVDT